MDRIEETRERIRQLRASLQEAFELAVTAHYPILDSAISKRDEARREVKQLKAGIKKYLEDHDITEFHRWFKVQEQKALTEGEGGDGT